MFNDILSYFGIQTEEQPTSYFSPPPTPPSRLQENTEGIFDILTDAALAVDSGIQNILGTGSSEEPTKTPERVVVEQKKPTPIEPVIDEIIEIPAGNNYSAPVGLNHMTILIFSFLRIL